MIYMDNAATTMQKPPQVAEAVVLAMGTLGNAGRGASEASLGAARVIYESGSSCAAGFTAKIRGRSYLR